jgi:hypothetical protein
MFNSYLLAGSSRNCLSRANPANRYSRTDEIWQYLKVFFNVAEGKNDVRLR